MIASKANWFKSLFVLLLIHCINRFVLSLDWFDVVLIVVVLHSPRALTTDKSTRSTSLLGL